MRPADWLRPASRFYVGALFVVSCVVIGVVAYVLAVRPINDLRGAQSTLNRAQTTLNGKLDVVQRDVLAVPCLHPDQACRNFLALLIANATPRQLRHLAAVARRLRRHPTAAIIRGAHRVSRHKAVVRRRRHRTQRLPTLKPQPPHRLRAPARRPQRRGGGAHGHSGIAHGLPGRSAAHRGPPRRHHSPSGGHGS